MNRFDEMFIFRKATKNDLHSIAAFFDNVWKKNGILSDVDFLSYEFEGSGEEINIILAIKKESGEIQGLWGYYPFSCEESFLDVAGGPWSVKQDKDCMPFLGNEIMVRAKEIIKYRTMLGIGDNQNTSGFYHRRIRKDVVGRLNHFYMLNEIDNYKIAVIKNFPATCLQHIEDSKVNICEINNFVEIDDEFWNNLDKGAIPYKDKKYIEKRFFRHPIYKYTPLGMYSENKLMAIAFMRLLTVGDSCINRIVDYIGNKNYIVTIGSYLKSYMKKEGCEYTDFYNYGFEKELMQKAGFIERVEDDINIIPNYFEPFVQKNVEILFSAPVSNITLCKADGDQDRPNYLRRN